MSDTNSSTEMSRILLETGTNEVEIAEFQLCGQRYGINAAKTREFLPFRSAELKKMPGRHPSVKGVFILRGQAIPLIDLRAHLNLGPAEYSDQHVIVVVQFNALITSFVADEVHRIHRVSWEEFQPSDPYLVANAPDVIGTVAVGDTQVLVLDMEYIVSQIFPQRMANYRERVAKLTPGNQDRARVKVYLVEDSPTIRNQIVTALKLVGYSNVVAFQNGQEALHAIVEFAATPPNDLDVVKQLRPIVITDIEMPRLDGLTLCKMIRRDIAYHVPVVVFSSLIDEPMIVKCQRVGADACIVKPRIDELIIELDKLMLGNQEA